MGAARKSEMWHSGAACSFPNVRSVLRIISFGGHLYVWQTVVIDGRGDHESSSTELVVEGADLSILRMSMSNKARLFESWTKMGDAPVSSTATEPERVPGGVIGIGYDTRDLSRQSSSLVGVNWFDEIMRMQARDSRIGAQVVALDFREDGWCGTVDGVKQGGPCLHIGGVFGDMPSQGHNDRNLPESIVWSEVQSGSKAKPGSHKLIWAEPVFPLYRYGEDIECYAISQCVLRDAFAFGYRMSMCGTDLFANYSSHIWGIIDTGAKRAYIHSFCQISTDAPVLCSLALFRGPHAALQDDPALDRQEYCKFRHV